MTERVNIEKDGERPVGKTKGRTSGKGEGRPDEGCGKDEGRAKEVRMKNEERRVKDG